MDKWLSFASSSELLRVPPDAAVYIAADGNYSALHMADGGSFVVTSQLGQIERRIAESLDSARASRFIRIGKSLIVNSL